MQSPRVNSVHRMETSYSHVKATIRKGERLKEILGGRNKIGKIGFQYPAFVFFMISISIHVPFSVSTTILKIGLINLPKETEICFLPTLSAGRSHLYEHTLD